MKHTLLAFAVVVTVGFVPSVASAQYAWLSDDGTLTVRGTNRDESITLRTKDVLRKGYARTVNIIVTIQAWGTTYEKSFRGELVDLIVVNAKGGDDRIDNKTGFRSDLYGGDGDDTIHGGSASDHIYGGHGKNRLYGHEGHDWLFADGDAANQMYGGEGLDIYDCYVWDYIQDGTYADDDHNLLGLGYFIWADYTYPNSNGEHFRISE